VEIPIPGKPAYPKPTMPDIVPGQIPGIEDSIHWVLNNYNFGLAFLGVLFFIRNLDLKIDIELSTRGSVFTPIGGDFNNIRHHYVMYVIYDKNDISARLLTLLYYRANVEIR
jgi:hypothetical protein